MLACPRTGGADGARGGTRTPTSFDNRNLNQRVYQFRHARAAQEVRAYSKDGRLGNPRQLPAAAIVGAFKEIDHAAAPRPKNRSSRRPNRRNPASRPSRRPKRRSITPDIDVPSAAVAGNHALARADFAGRLAPQLGRGDDRFEIGQERPVIMRPGRIELDQIELAVDHRLRPPGPCATIRRCRDARNRAGSRWCRGTAAAASEMVRNSIAPPRTRYRLSSIAAISGGVMSERNLGTCWSARLLWRIR